MSNVNTDKAQLIPLFDHIVMEPCEPIKKIGSFHVPEAHQKILCQGMVVDKGPNVSDKIKNGDIVFFQQHSESRLNFRGRSFIIVPENQCLGIIRGAKMVEIDEAPRILIPGNQIITKP